MRDLFKPISNQRLSDGLAQRVHRLIQEGGFAPGDRLPTISDMAGRFGVGHATLREALKKLETLGVVSIKHGSGIYVSPNPDALLITNPIACGAPSKKLLMDLVDARLLIETKTAALAARHARKELLAQMREKLREEAEAWSGQDSGRLPTKMRFHRQVAQASENIVLSQILEVIANLFQQEQETILSLYSSTHDDLAEHRQIFEAIEMRNEALAAERMQTHLERVRALLSQWDPEENPVGLPNAPPGPPAAGKERA